MQSRNSNSQFRLLLIGCLAALLVTGVLYFLKRLEASKLSTELSATKVDKRATLDELNGKLTDYLQKIEEMNQEMASLRSKLKSCEDYKANLEMETKTAKNAVSECMAQQSDHMGQQKELEEEIATLKDKCDQAGEMEKQHLATVTQLQQSLREAESDLDDCQTKATQCQNIVSGLQTEVVQAKARCDQIAMQQRPPAMPFSSQNQAQRYQPANINQQRVPLINNQLQQFPVPNQVAAIPGRTPNHIPSQQVENDEEQNEPSYPEEEDQGNGLEEVEVNELNENEPNIDTYGKKEEEFFGDNNQLGETETN